MVSSNFRRLIILSNILNLIQTKSMKFKITNNKTKVITVIIKKSILNPNRINSNPTMVGINTMNPDRSRLLTNMVFLTKLTLKSRFLYENKIGI